MHGAATPSEPGLPRYQSFTITLIYTHSNRYDSSGRVIGPKQGPQPENTQLSEETDRRRVSNRRSQQP